MLLKKQLCSPVCLTPPRRGSCLGRDEPPVHLAAAAHPPPLHSQPPTCPLRGLGTATAPAPPRAGWKRGWRQVLPPPPLPLHLPRPRPKSGEERGCGAGEAGRAGIHPSVRPSIRPSIHPSTMTVGATKSCPWSPLGALPDAGAGCLVGFFCLPLTLTTLGSLSEFHLPVLCSAFFVRGRNGISKGESGISKGRNAIFPNIIGCIV